MPCDRLVNINTERNDIVIVAVDVDRMVMTVLMITVLMLARGWWLAPSHGSWRGSAWKNRATYPLIASTALAVTLRSLRSANVLGESPLQERSGISALPLIPQRLATLTLQNLRHKAVATPRASCRLRRCPP